MSIHGIPRLWDPSTVPLPRQSVEVNSSSCRGRGQPMLKVIFFDLDGVLTVDKTGSLTTTRYLSQATGVELPRVQAAFARRNADLTLGRCTHASSWAGICRDLGTDIDMKSLHEAFASTPMNEPMLALARQLKLNYSVGMITDNKVDRIDC